MNPDNVEAELKRALEALEAARVLEHAVLYADAASRAYYAVMHSARAALLFHDEVTESHAGLRARFGAILVQTGLIEREWARILAVEQHQRIGADYGAPATINADRCRQLVADAERFVERIRRYLAEQGLQIR